jgi:uncharacterized protein YfaS (alpha-2-macroglobulin family)
MNTYQPGNIVTLAVLFTTNDVPPIPADPTTVTLRVTDPSGTETAYTGGQLNHTSTGDYSMDLEVLANGYWNYRWEGLGAIIAANESRFLVKQSAFPNPQ